MSAPSAARSGHLARSLAPGGVAFGEAQLGSAGLFRSANRVRKTARNRFGIAPGAW